MHATNHRLLLILQIHLLKDSAMFFLGNSATMEGGGIHVRAPSVAIDFNIDPIFNTGCFIQYEVSTEPFSLDPSNWKVWSTHSKIQKFLNP